MTTSSGTATKILLTGASGYLGQHLLWHWMTKGLPGSKGVITIIALYNQSSTFVQAIQAVESKVLVIPLCCNLTDPSEVDAVFHQYSFDVCIHTAALSSPAVCQQDPDQARKVNVPEYFLQKLRSVPKVIALSTDQVYDGTKNTPYQEAIDIPNPLNIYGQTKLEMESSLQSHPQCIILRSSIILGPKAPLGVAHDTFFHFCATRQDEATSFFTNEYRSVVCVHHVCRVIDFFVTTPTCATIFHMGGPLRVNRLQMAKAVFDFFGFNPVVLIPAEQSSSTSPLDITMDSSRLEEVTKIIHEQRTLHAMVQSTFQDL